MINDAHFATTRDLNTIRYESAVQYDCSKGIWNKIVSVPFLNTNGEIRGVVAISISLNKFDLKQCGDERLILANETDENGILNKRNAFFDRERDPFYDTDRCDRISTNCKNEEGYGFALDSYICKCKPGFYPTNHPTTIPHLSCLKCSEGCETCTSAQPCQTSISLDFKRTALAINLFCILLCLILIIIVWYNMSLMALKTSSPKMLFMVLVGAVVSYCEIIPMYFEANYWTCTSAQVCQLLGFLLAYGGLVLKTWRECKLFYVRSVKTVKITDTDLMKRLGAIMGIGTGFLAAWALQKEQSPRGFTAYDTQGLKYEMCTITEWNFISMAIQFGILLWGIILSIQVRRASIAFKETKLITWAIFNEGVVCLAVMSITVLLKYTRVSCYVPFSLSFIRIHLTISVMLLLLFSYKVYKIFVARKKPYQGNSSSGIINSHTVTGKDGELKGSTVNEAETEKERELRIEIQRLYRQIEEMRSLSMRIANPHLITKKSKFIYPTKKFKIKKLNSETVSRTDPGEYSQSGNNEVAVSFLPPQIEIVPPATSANSTPSTTAAKKRALNPIEEDGKSLAK